MMHNLLDAIIIDNGSSITKAGFSSDDSPRTLFPTIVGRSKYHYQQGGVAQSSNSSKSNAASYVGDQAQFRRGILSMSYPVDAQTGNITNWDDMESLWHYIYYDEFKVAPDEHPLILADSALKQQKEKIAYIMFETFNVPSMYLCMHAQLALYASGRTTGLVLESGDGSTRAVPIFEASPIAVDYEYSPLAGRDLTCFMATSLEKKGFSFLTQADKEIVRDIKEKTCYIPVDYEFEKVDAENCPSHEKFYELPDGQMITVCQERLKCPQALFKPEILYCEVNNFAHSVEANKAIGIHEAIYEAINECDPSIMKDMYSNIILSGGNTMFDGIEERLQKEMTLLAPYTMKIKVVAPCERKYLAWLGGSVLSALNVFKEMSISRKDYDEYGPSIMHRKCV